MEAWFEYKATMGFRCIGALGGILSEKFQNGYVVTENMTRALFDIAVSRKWPVNVAALTYTINTLAYFKQ